MRGGSQRCRTRGAAAAALLAACLLLPALAAPAPAPAAGLDEAAVMSGLRSALQRAVPELAAAAPGWQPGSQSHHCDWEFVLCDDHPHGPRIVQLSLALPCSKTHELWPHCTGERAEPADAGDAGAPAGDVQRALAGLSRLRWLQHLEIKWTGEPLGAALPPEWLQPGVWPALTRLSLELPTRAGAPPLPDIPPGAWPSLAFLELRLWHLRSTLPRAWGGPHVLPALQTLSLQLRVEGGLPAQWARGFSHLTTLLVVDRAHGASAGGALPAEWAGGFKRLVYLDISWMGITGTVPPAWLRPGSFPALLQLNLDGNALTGTLPPRLFERLPSLTFLDISRNLFTGTLPDEWAGCQATSLALSGNRLSGAAFPASWIERGMPGLKFLYLSNNSALTGNLPTVLPWPELYSLALDGTGVHGSIPPGWCTSAAAQTLFSLYLGGTQVNPALPCKAGQMPHLSVDLGTPGPGDRHNQRSPAAPQRRKQRAAVVSLATLLPLCCMAAVVVASRLLLRRRRRQLVRQALEQQSLLQQKQDSDRGSSAGGAAEGGTASRAAPPASMVRRTQRSRLMALLSNAIGRDHCLPMIPLEGGRIVHELGHTPTQHAADGPPWFSGAAAWHAQSSVQPPPSIELAPLLRQSQRHAATAGAAQGWRWGLPTDSLRVPSTSLEFLVDRHNALVELGAGRFAIVFSAVLDPGRQPVAVKVFELEPGIDAGMVWQEIAIHRQCHHPRVVPLLGVVMEGSLLMLSMQLMPGGSLMQALQRPSGRQQLRWVERGRQVVLDVAEALDHLHTQLGVLHSDIKPANVLLSADWRASIADLGLAQVVGGGARAPVGYNKPFAAPEQLVGVRCTLSADVYSFGMLLVALLTQEPLTQRGSWRMPCAPQECPQDVVSLIEECLAIEPQQRPTAAAVLTRLRSPPTAMFAAALSQPRLASGLQRRAAAPRSCRGSRLICAAKLVLTPVGTGKTEHIGEEVPMPGAIELKEGLFELGRAAPADLIIGIPTVSTRHAMLRVSDVEAPAAGSVQVTDLGSTNGTSVDGEELVPMKAVALPVGGEVIFGDKHLAAFRLDFVPDAPPAAAPAAPAAEEAPAAAPEAPAAAAQE